MEEMEVNGGNRVGGIVGEYSKNSGYLRQNGDNSENSVY